MNLGKGSHAPLGSFAEPKFRPIDETRSEYYLPLDVVDRPGVLHAVTGVFAQHDVSIRTAILFLPNGRGAPMLFAEWRNKGGLQPVRPISCDRRVELIQFRLDGLAQDQDSPRSNRIGSRQDAELLEIAVRNPNNSSAVGTRPSCRSA